MNLSKDLRKFREECDNGSSYWFSDDHRDCGSAFKGQDVPDRGTGAVVPAIAGSDSPVFPVEIMGFIADGIKTTTKQWYLIYLFRHLFWCSGRYRTL